MKSCELFQPLLDEWVDGTLTGERRASMENHLAGCETCRLELHQLVQVQKWMEAAGQAPQETPPLHAWNAEVLEKLVKIREARQVSRWWVWAPPTLVAAALVVVMLWPRQPSRPDVPTVPDLVTDLSNNHRPEVLDGVVAGTSKNFPNRRRPISAHQEFFSILPSSALMLPSIPSIWFGERNPMTVVVAAMGETEKNAEGRLFKKVWVEEVLKGDPGLTNAALWLPDEDVSSSMFPNHVFTPYPTRVVDCPRGHESPHAVLCLQKQGEGYRQAALLPALMDVSDLGEPGLEYVRRMANALALLDEGERRKGTHEETLKLLHSQAAQVSQSVFRMGIDEAKYQMGFLKNDPGGELMGYCQRVVKDSMASKNSRLAALHAISWHDQDTTLRFFLSLLGDPDKDVEAAALGELCSFERLKGATPESVRQVEERLSALLVDPPTDRYREGDIRNTLKILRGSAVARSSMMALTLRFEGEIANIRKSREDISHGSFEELVRRSDVVAYGVVRNVERNVPSGEGSWERLTAYLDLEAVFKGGVTDPRIRYTYLDFGRNVRGSSPLSLQVGQGVLVCLGETFTEEGSLQLAPLHGKHGIIPLSIGDDGAKRALVARCENALARSTFPALQEQFERAWGTPDRGGLRHRDLQVLAAELASLHEPRAVPLLVRCLKDERLIAVGHPEVRVWAAQALSKIRTPEAVDALITLFQETDENVPWRSQLVDALAYTLDRRTLAMLEAFHPTREEDIKARRLAMGRIQKTLFNIPLESSAVVADPPGLKPPLQQAGFRPHPVLSGVWAGAHGLAAIPGPPSPSRWLNNDDIALVGLFSVGDQLPVPNDKGERCYNLYIDQVYKGHPSWEGGILVIPGAPPAIPVNTFLPTDPTLRLGRSKDHSQVVAFFSRRPDGVFQLANVAPPFFNVADLGEVGVNFFRRAASYASLNKEDRNRWIRQDLSGLVSDGIPPVLMNAVVSEIDHQNWGMGDRRDEEKTAFLKQFAQEERLPASVRKSSIYYYLARGERQWDLPFLLSLVNDSDKEVRECLLTGLASVKLSPDQSVLVENGLKALLKDPPRGGTSTVQYALTGLYAKNRQGRPPSPLVVVNWPSLDRMMNRPMSIPAPSVILGSCTVVLIAEAGMRDKMKMFVVEEVISGDPSMVGGVVALSMDVDQVEGGYPLPTEPVECPHGHSRPVVHLLLFLKSEPTGGYQVARDYFPPYADVREIGWSGVRYFRDVARAAGRNDQSPYILQTALEVLRSQEVTPKLFEFALHERGGEEWVVLLARTARDQTAPDWKRVMCLEQYAIHQPKREAKELLLGFLDDPHKKVAYKSLRMLVNQQLLMGASIEDVKKVEERLADIYETMPQGRYYFDESIGDNSANVSQALQNVRSHLPQNQVARVQTIVLTLQWDHQRSSPLLSKAMATPSLKGLVRASDVVVRGTVNAFSKDALKQHVSFEVHEILKGRFIGDGVNYLWNSHRFICEDRQLTLEAGQEIVVFLDEYFSPEGDLELKLTYGNGSILPIPLKDPGAKKRLLTDIKDLFAHSTFPDLAKEFEQVWASTDRGGLRYSELYRLATDLGALRDPLAIPLLERCLNDERLKAEGLPPVQIWIVSALSKIRNPESSGILVDLLEKTVPQPWRWRLFEAVAYAMDRRVLGALKLVQPSGDREIEARRVAIDRLNKNFRK